MLLNYKYLNIDALPGVKSGILDALELLSGTLGVRPVILSGWRPFDALNPNSRHFFGDAVDIWFPAINPLEIIAAVESQGNISGFGIYLNEKGIVSYHLDTRPGQFARWGAFIEPIYNPVTGTTDRIRNYTSFNKVSQTIKSLFAIVGEKPLEFGLSTLLVVVAIYFILKT